MEHSAWISLLDGEEDIHDDIIYDYLSRLVTRPDLLSRLQDLKLDGREKNVSFQWLGPHFIAFLKHASNLYLDYHETVFLYYLKFHDLLKRLDYSALSCISSEETEDYIDFLKIILSLMPEIKELFTIQKKYSDSGSTISNYMTEAATFISFLLETIGELLSCRTNSCVLVSNQVKVLWKELRFLLTFLVDTMRCIKLDQSKNEFTEFESRKQEQIEKMFEENILKEIEAVSNEAGLFLHSFFFTTDLVTTTKMDLAISVLLERIEIVRVKIKDYCIEVSMKQNCGSGSLQVAESSSKVSSSQDRSVTMVEEMIVGLDDMTKEIVRKLLGGPNYRQVISIHGMGGLGKTTLAKKIYNHSNVKDHFDKLSWCVVSQTYQKRKLLVEILISVCNLNRDEISETEGEEELAERLYKNLKGIRYLIVMDDIWDQEAWDDLKKLFPEDKNGSRVLFTSRLKNVVLEISHVIIEPPPLSSHESWNLLQQMVFKKERCPQELQDIGKQIATNCHGLPLSVITIAGVLSNMQKKESLWQQVAQSLSSYISQKADDYIPTLKLSYMHLPNHLKPCFLYLSAFQEDEEIPVRKILLLWIAEGLVEKREHKSLEDVAEEYLMELINRSLLQVDQTRSNNGVKTFTLHDLVFDMCIKIAVEDENFLLQYQFLISKHRHRLCMDQSHHLSKALAILYDSEKVRILDSEYCANVPLEIKTMSDLRYLEIPTLTSSIGTLQNLYFLLVNNQLDTHIPAYLLNMPKLRHLRFRTFFLGTRFSKNCDRSRVNSLETLCYVIIDDPKDEEILRCSPNLRALKYTCQSDNFCLDLNFLCQLESLKMVYESRFKGDYSVVNFPKNIRKLTLSKIGLPWEKMSLIGTLPNLEILKLEREAFEGDIWNTKDEEFQKLKFLKLDHLDLKQWNSSHDHFHVLERLLLNSCENLEIPFDFSYSLTIQWIEVYYCGENVKSSASQIREEQQENGNEEFKVIIFGDY